MKLIPLSRNVIDGMRAYYTTEADDDEDEDIIIPSGMTIEMSAVIQCSTGARAQQYLNHPLTSVFGCIISLGIGMCTAIKNGLLMSQPNPNEASNFSPHFTPPVDAEDGLSAELQLRLEEQAVMESCQVMT